MGKWTEGGWYTVLNEQMEIYWITKKREWCDGEQLWMNRGKHAWMDRRWMEERRTAHFTTRVMVGGNHRSLHGAGNGTERTRFNASFKRKWKRKKITDWCKDYFLKRCLCVGCYLKIRSINYRGHVWLCPPLWKLMDIFSHVVLEITPSHLSESWKDPKKFQKASRVLLALYSYSTFWGKGNAFLIALDIVLSFPVDPA